ncbi:hypothetical protein BDB00DRAFT_788421 [Zychaea mexicana]|uniref:uncharacterized protein n=1 Tax=Zychaea mexicana TaxID=64656 RepID=UPI0022FE5716|nr:uncharacterized protein BDB00DRAFT_788421 [Zychaea mexicana]KAI9492765.1 hypothetical protein BDB00DRAFT_788421 [Zychaea mexicana]
MATNRPGYRDSKTPRAVKVYSIAQESRYLVYENVPALGLVDNLTAQCQSFGSVQQHGMLDSHAASDEFHDVVWVQFATVMSARKAKRTMDDRPFFANVLRVSYAPEFETVEDFRNKLQERHRSAASSSSLALQQQRQQKKSRLKDQRSIITAAATAAFATATLDTKAVQPTIGPVPYAASQSSSPNAQQAKKKRRRI